MADLLKIANSWQMWVICGSIVAMVLAQALLFVRLCRREAITINYPVKNLNRAIYNGAITAIGPALAGIVIMISMMALVGSPITWQRLSVIGSAQSELMVADIAASVMGVTLGGHDYTMSAMTLCYLLLAIAGNGWLLVTTIFTGSMEKVRTKLAGGDAVWLGLFSASASIGLISYMCARNLTAGLGAAVATIAGFLVQFCIDKFIAPKWGWIKGYSMAFAIVIGICAAYLVQPV